MEVANYTPGVIALAARAAGALVRGLLRPAPLVAAGLLAAGPAGAFHESLRCSDCHAVKGPSLAFGDETGLGPTSLCLRCHDGAGRAPDVLRDDGRSGGTASPAVRPAGGLNALGDGDGARNGGWAETSGHTIGSSLRPPGAVGGWPDGWVLGCTSCHDAHVNGLFRNLRLVLFVRGGALPRTVRAAGDAVGTLPAMNAFCAGCHGRFHGREHTQGGGDGSAGGFLRHPTSDVPLSGRVRARLDGVAEPLRIGRSEAGEPEVACLTCHRAHGSLNPFALVYWDRAATENGEEGAGDGPEALCRNCHDVDAAAPLPQPDGVSRAGAAP